MIKMTVTVFELNDDFYVEVSPSITTDDCVYDFHLGNKGYGVKMFMFSAETHEAAFMDLINENIDEYIEFYIDEYFD